VFWYIFGVTFKIEHPVRQHCIWCWDNIAWQSAT